jgi:iron complex outermembrane receptor protein
LLALALAGAAQQTSRDLTALSLEDLMNIEVTSVSKKGQKLSRTAAAIFAIGAEDIHRSGAKNIPDLLRMVPGMDVAQLDANVWGISVRGLNGRFANNLLVLVDGREVYVPTYGGVFWDVLDLPLEDIDRIEVIRGPGGSLWGANAVNGVVNIITKPATETHGGLVVAGGGNVGQAFATTQYGDRLGKGTDYRLYTKYLNQGALVGFTNPHTSDNWHLMRGGFRTDSVLTTRDTLTVEGDIYRGRVGLTMPLLVNVFSPRIDTQAWVDLSGGFIQSAWKHQFSERSETSLQISFDRFTRLDVIGEDRNHFSLDFQHHFAWTPRHDLVWGASFVHSKSNSRGSPTMFLQPSTSSLENYGAFVQDEIALLPQRLYFTVGTKLDHNVFTGFNVMPSARLAWLPSKEHTLWAAVSRAVRTPGVDDISLRVNYGGFPGPGGLPILMGQMGNPQFGDERLIAYEAGYRTTALKNLSLDISAFYNAYSNKQTLDPSVPFLESIPAPLHLMVPFRENNLMYGEGHGLEIALNWKVTNRWKLSPGYAFEGIHMHLRVPSVDWASVLIAEASSPVHSAQLRSLFSITPTVEWNAAAYFVDRLRSGPIPAYTRVDTGITWHATVKLALSAFGQNLSGQHLEMLDSLRSVRSSYIGRAGYGAVTWQF